MIYLLLLILWIALTLKKSRKDGVLIERVHPYRQLMQYIMPTRNESIVYFDEYINAEKLLAYCAEAKEKFSADFTHCLIGAASIALLANPAMNRFVVGRRLYQRKGHHITFSMKRKKQDAKAKLSVVKMDIRAEQNFKILVQEIEAKINVERSDKKTYADKEFQMFSLIPRPVLRLFVALFKALDYYNMLPYEFIRNDGLYTSIVFTNLGSVGMGAAYHHLYEWGTCPLFLAAGPIQERPVWQDNAFVPQKILHIRFAYDERIDDGLTAGQGIATFKKILENPYEYLGCLKDDQSDALLFDPLARAEK